MRDWVPKGELSFLAGDSEMARRIRAHRWAEHPFGPVETWPQSLRSALSICLHSAFPTAIYWGSEFRLLYNDAWATVPGPRHPDALGAPAREVWSDIWHVIEPQLVTVMRTGEGLFTENQMLPMARFGAPEETYWNYSFTAIRGEDGEVAGVFNCGNETTHGVRSERQMRFLLDYGEALGAADSPAEARRLALSMLGEHLSVDRVGIAESGEDRGQVSISGEWTRSELKPLDPVVPLSQFGPAIAEALHAGRTVICDDVSGDARFDGDARQALARLDIAAFIALPWLVRGRMVGLVYMHSRRPRDWSIFDVTTVEGLLQRTRAWIEAERAAEREQIMVREIDHRAKNVLAVAQSVVRLTRADDMTAFRKKIDERIAALARAHGLLAAQHWRSIGLRELVAQELKPYTAGGGAEVEIDGPDVSLPPDLAQTAALVLHELATNAAKHGALAVAEGRLAVRWRLAEPRTLRFEWSETLPEARWVDAPTERGFGSLLLARVIEVQLGGSLQTDFARDGLKIRITLPLGPLDDSLGAVPSDAEAPAMRVLVVDDETVTALELESTLGLLGHDVVGVSGTLEAAEAVVARRRPDVVILAPQARGGGSSIEFARRLVKDGVKVVFLNGHEPPPDLPAALAGLPVLSKPVDEDRLAAALDRVFGHGSTDAARTVGPGPAAADRSLAAAGSPAARTRV